MPYKSNGLDAARILLEDCAKNQVASTFDDVLLEPQFSDIGTRSVIGLLTWVSPLRQINIPFIAANMDSVCESKMAIAMDNEGGLGVIHRYMSYERQIEEVTKVAANSRCANVPLVAAAVGVKNGVVDHVKRLVDAGVGIIVIDVAHGHHKLVGDLVHDLRSEAFVAKDGLPVEYMAGNVATPDGVEYLCLSGADIIKVGVGPGSLCTTRIVTGHGIPQLLAIASCALMASKYNRPIVADGGIRNSGDVVKALAAGANSVMCGSLFAGTDETPGEFFGDPNGQRYKMYRGMASTEAQRDFYGNDPDAPEGTTTTVRSKGPLADVLKQLVSGVRSGLSYSGSYNLPEFQEKASWISISPSAMRESLPHLLFK